MTTTEALGEVIVKLGGTPSGDTVAELIHEIAELIGKPEKKSK